jgi:hypothetical protein
MPKITALSNIKHDGKDYVAGDVVPVNEADAAWLVSLGAAEVEKPTKASKKAAEPAATDAATA